MPTTSSSRRSKRPPPRPPRLAFTTRTSGLIVSADSNTVSRAQVTTRRKYLNAKSRLKPRSEWEKNQTESWNVRLSAPCPFRLRRDSSTQNGSTTEVGSVSEKDSIVRRALRDSERMNTSRANQPFLTDRLADFRTPFGHHALRAGSHSEPPVRFSCRPERAESDRPSPVCVACARERLSARCCRRAAARAGSRHYTHQSFRLSIRSIVEMTTRPSLCVHPFELPSERSRSSAAEARRMGCDCS